MKRYSDYPAHIRAEALRRLREVKGIKVWDQTFDPESEQVRQECAAVEAAQTPSIIL